MLEEQQNSRNIKKESKKMLRYLFRKINTTLFMGEGGPTQKKSKKSKSISGILGWVLTFFDPKF